MSFFERIPPGGIPEFNKFTLTHLVTAVICFIIIYLFWISFEKIRDSKYEKLIRYSIGIAMLLSNISIWLYAYNYGLPWYKYLPEATCGWAVYFGGIGLLTKNRTLLMLTLYWGFGALTTILGANVLEGITRYNFYQFFLRHVLIIVAGFYMIKVLGFKLYRSDFIKFFYITFLMVVVGGVISNVVNDPEALNMFYTMKPGIEGTPLSYFLELSYWLYLVIWIAVAAVLSHLYVYPFYEKVK